MNIWENTTITQKGQALLNAVIAGTKAMTITRAVAGAGTVSLTELILQNDVTDIQQTLILNTAIVTDEKLVLPVVITNYDLETGYTAKQIGVFAQAEGEEEILFFIAQSTTGQIIPSTQDMPNGYTAEFHFVIATANASKLNITVDATGLLTESAADEKYASKEHKHTMEDFDEGQLSIEAGGTGADNAADAFRNLAYRDYISDDNLKNADDLKDSGIYLVNFGDENTAISYNYPERVGFLRTYSEPLNYSNCIAVQIFCIEDRRYQRGTWNIHGDPVVWTGWSVGGSKQSGRNLLFNADFKRLINSSGLTSFTGSYEECIDGWVLSNSNSGTSGAVHISEEGIVSDADGTKIYQVINKNSIKLDATYTVSAEINGELKQFTATPYNEKEAESMRFGVDHDSNSGMFEIWLNQGDVVTRAKVEEGEACTLQDEYAADHYLNMLITKACDPWGNYTGYVQQDYGSTEDLIFGVDEEGLYYWEEEE